MVDVGDVQGTLVSYIGRLRMATANFTDERVRLIGEAIAGCMAVKMMGACLPCNSYCPREFA
jgi:hypothetical protein